MNHRDLLLNHLRKEGEDEESDHCIAEDLLCEWLQSIGDNELADAWKQAEDVQGWGYA